MDRTSANQLKRLLSRELLLPPRLRNAVEAVVQANQSGARFAAAGVLPRSLEPDHSLRRQSVYRVYELSFEDLILQHDTVQRLGTQEDDGNVIPTETSLQSQSSSLPEPKRIALEQIANAAVQLSDLPSEVLRLIFAAYSQHVVGAVPTISLVSRKFLEASQKRLVQMSRPPNPHAKSFRAGAVNACIVALLQLTIREAPIPWDTYFPGTENLQIGAAEDDANGVTWLWDMRGEQNFHRRRINLGWRRVEWDMVSTARRAYTVELRTFMSARYYNRNDGGALQFDASAAVDPTCETKITRGVLIRQNDAYFFDPAAELDNQTEKIFTDLMRHSSRPENIEWNSHYGSTVYGRSLARLEKSGKWQKYLEIQTCLPLPGLDIVMQLQNIRPWPRPATYLAETIVRGADDNNGRWRTISTILELARCADETSVVKVESADLSPQDPARHTARNLRTNVAQYTYSSEHLEWASKSEYTESALLDTYLGEKPWPENSGYWLSFDATIPAKMIDLGPFQPDYGSFLNVGRRLRSLLYLFLLPLKNRDRDLARDVASCFVINIMSDVIDVGEAFHFDETANGEPTPSEAAKIDLTGLIHIYINLPKYSHENTATNKERYEFDAANGCVIQYRVSVNRTKLRKLLQRHTLESVEAEFQTLWLELETKIVDDWRPSAAELSAADEAFL